MQASVALSTLARDMETTTPWQQRRVEAMGRLRHLRLASYRQNSDGLFSPVQTFIGLPFPRHTRALESVAALSVALFRVRVRHGPPQTLLSALVMFESHVRRVHGLEVCAQRHGAAEEMRAEAQLLRSLCHSCLVDGGPWRMCQWFTNGQTTSGVNAIPAGFWNWVEEW